MSEEPEEDPQVFRQGREPANLKPCRKKTIAHAKRIDAPFIVHTMEGVMTGKAGDFLMKGVRGELYVCDASIFEESYEFIEEGKE